MKMFDNSNTRIFLQGNEDVARWHLPVVLSKFKAFVRRCKEAGLKQDRFTMFFEDTGTSVFGQYFYGEESVQLYSPLRSVVLQEKSKVDLSAEGGPKTFFISTVQGYFWVEVRYAESGAPIVILTPFVAVTIADDGITESFVYPGFALNAPGMLSGCFDDDPGLRYVVAQNGGVMAGAGQEKGTIRSTQVIDASARITPLHAADASHGYVLMKNSGGRNIEIRKLNVSKDVGEIAVSRDYFSVDMEAEGVSNISVANMLQNPTWIHRKCSGSYFSPNKTIGYHVDIGADAFFLGNTDESAGVDLLDNSGGFEESMFNHTNDMYRVLSILSAPVETSDVGMKFIASSPTMRFTNDKGSSKMCWGGFGLTQSWAGCVDYMQDFDAWVLSPRPVIVSLNFSSGNVEIEDPSESGSFDGEFSILSWDGYFKSNISYKTSYECDSVYHNEMLEKSAGEQCSWIEDCSNKCSTDDPGSTGTCPNGWEPFTYWEYFSRENIRNSKKLYFSFGLSSPSFSNPAKDDGFFLMFDGLWHLDIGVLWADSKTVGNSCGICSSPLTGQDPGENITFMLQGGDADWVIANGREYVKNLEVVSPLGIVSWPAGGSGVGFVVRVPDAFSAPHPPVVLTGGIEYASKDVEGETIRCERSLMSTPCECTGNPLYWDDFASLTLSGGYMYIHGGCPPYTWQITGGVFIDALGNSIGSLVANTTDVTIDVVVTDACAVSVAVTDSCETTITKFASADVEDGVVVGPLVLQPDEEAYYAHNLGVLATYTGTLILVSNGIGGAVLKAPSSLSGGEYVASFETNACGYQVATLDVGVGEYCPYPTTGTGEPVAGMRVSNTTRTRCWVVEQRDLGLCCLSSCGTPSDTWSSYSDLNTSTPVGGYVRRGVIHSKEHRNYPSSDPPYGCVESYLGLASCNFYGDRCRWGWGATCIWVKP